MIGQVATFVKTIGFVQKVPENEDKLFVNWEPSAETKMQQAETSNTVVHT